MAKAKGIRVVLISSLVITDEEERRLRDPHVLQQLHNVAEAKEPLVKYFSEAAAKLGLTAGYLRCEFDAGKSEVRIITEYDAPRRLTKAELKTLIDETRGQWMDGVGESFFDDFCEVFDCEVDVASKTAATQEAGTAWRPPKNARPPKFKKPPEKPAAKGDVRALSKKLLNAEEAPVIRKLLQAGADPNARNRDDEQMLHIPPILKDVKIVKLLLEHGADVNGTKSGKTPLMIAASFGWVPIMRLLLQAGANIHADDHGPTALSEAVGSDASRYGTQGTEFIQELLNAGAKITPWVMAAAGQADVKIVRLLLKSGGDVNAAPGDRGTALAYAVDFGKTEVVKLLLAAGANPNVKLYGNALLAIALKAGNTAIVKMLRAAGAREG